MNQQRADKSAIERAARRQVSARKSGSKLPHSEKSFRCAFPADSERSLRRLRQEFVEVYNPSMATEVIPKLSFEEFRQLPSDGRRYELVGGEMHVTPAPATRHQSLVQNLSGNLWPCVIKNHWGEVWTAPLDVRLSGETALQPDLVFISNARAGIIQENLIAGAPDLIVEVLSPSTATFDRVTKLPIYADAGVLEVWLIDSQAITVEALKLRGKKYVVEASHAGDQELTSKLFPGWRLPLRDLFDFRGRI